MPESPGDGNPFQLLLRRSPEGPPRCSQDDPGHAAGRIPLDALEYGAVLAVDGEQLRAAAGGLAHDDLAGADEGLLVREGDPLPRAHGLERRQHAGRADHRRDDRVRPGHRREAQHPLAPSRHLDGAADGRPQLRRPRLVLHRDEARLEAGDLLLQRGDVPADAEADDAELSGERLDDLEGVHPDGAGGPEDDDRLHRASTR